MLTFLFWNMKRLARQEVLARLVRRHNVDVIMLAECALGTEEVLTKLNAGGRAEYHYNPGLCPAIEIYSKLGGRHTRPIWEGDHLTIREIRRPGGANMLLAAAHLRSKLHQSRDSQTLASPDIANAIIAAEKKVRHQRTLLVGDLNMHPFEPGVVGATGLHATMDRRIAGQGCRTVGGKSYAFFYNPMWSHLGDSTHGPPGTYYYRESEHVAYFWHMFDQVLVRPDLLPAFANSDLQILVDDGEVSFLTPGGAPNEAVASDHLPLTFRLCV